VTKVDADHGFYPAKGYHQDYLIANPSGLYIATYDMPKIGFLKSTFPKLFTVKPEGVPTTASAS
jgi:peptide-methionine (S)-S-oxide reductase